MGRKKVELTDEQVGIIETLAGYGLTQAQIAECLPFGERTLRKRVNGGDDEEVAAAYRRGRAKSAEELAKRHRDIALGNVRDAKVSDQRKALEWRLERQHGWSQEIDHRHSGPGGGAIPSAVEVTFVDDADED